MNMYKILVILFVLLSSCGSVPKGTGTSSSGGSVSNGTLENGRRFLYKGENYRYFSPLSYALFNRAWVHSKVLDITTAAYAECEETCPGRKFMIMECSKKKGERPWPHRTHQNGTSIDFATPLIRKGKIYKADHVLGIYHYLMKFKDDGHRVVMKNVSIDFETMGKHILALDKAARKNGMYVKKVIFKLDLKDEFYKTKSGKKVKKKGIYFARNLPNLIDKVHDDHYHIDFAFLK